MTSRTTYSPAPRRPTKQDSKPSRNGKILSPLSTTRILPSFHGVNANSVKTTSRRGAQGREYPHSPMFTKFLKLLRSLAQNKRMNVLRLRVRNRCAYPSINPGGIQLNLERLSAWDADGMRSAGQCSEGHISPTSFFHHQTVTVMWKK